MKLLGQILFVCVLISALQALVAVIVFATLLFLAWALLFRTKQAIGFIAFCLLIEALQLYPIVTLCSIGLLVGVLLIARSKPSRAPSCQPPAKLLAPRSRPPD